ncbi:MAG TPA: TorF family putative porin [Caulobacteraceae bacterium]
MSIPLRHLSAAVSAPLFAWLFLPAQARAQFAVSATAESQYRVQGVSLTNGQPDGRIGVSYDNPSGAYGGASAIIGETVDDGVRPLGFLGYLGFAKQTRSGLDWDVGIMNTDITLYLSQPKTGPYPAKTGGSSVNPLEYKFDYTNIYAGVSGRNLSVKVYLSPDYLGQRVTTTYVDLSGVIRPVSRLRLYMHVGALTPLSGASGTIRREQFDLGPGAAWEFRHGEISLTWTVTTPRVEYPPGFSQRRSALVLSLTRSF